MKKEKSGQKNTIHIFSLKHHQKIEKNISEIIYSIFKWNTEIMI